jgi:hypothetical protein
LELLAGLEQVLSLQQIGDIDDCLPLEPKGRDIAGDVSTQSLLSGDHIPKARLPGNLLMALINAPVNPHLIFDLTPRNIHRS